MYGVVIYEKLPHNLSQRLYLYPLGMEIPMGIRHIECHQCARDGVLFECLWTLAMFVKAIIVREKNQLSSIVWAHIWNQTFIT